MMNLVENDFRSHVDSRYIGQSLDFDLERGFWIVDQAKQKFGLVSAFL